MDQDHLPPNGWLSGFGASLRVQHWARVAGSLLYDPTAGISGFIAGVGARSLIVLTDKKGWTAPLPSAASRRVQQMPDPRDLGTRINRRGLLYGMLFWFYIPVHRVAQFESTDPHITKERFKITVYAIMASTIAARLLLNIWSNIADAGRQQGMSMKIAYKYLTRNENLPGIATILVNQPPMLTALFYHGITFFLFESLRRYLKGHESWEEDQKNRSEPLRVVKVAVQNGVLAAGCASVASALTILGHRPYYRNELSRPNALAMPFSYILRREALMVGSVFGLFSMLQPIFSPHHSRCGFGY